MQEKYFVYLTSELAARIAELNAPESKEKPLIWCVGVDTGAYQACLLYTSLLELVRGGRVTLGPKGELTMQRGRLPREKAKEEE